MIILGFSESAGLTSHVPFCDNLSHDQKPTIILFIINMHNEKIFFTYLNHFRFRQKCACHILLNRLSIDIDIATGFRIMLFNATFKIMSVISWWSVLLEEETEVPGENLRAVESH